jgi:hypothetical protein
MINQFNIPVVLFFFKRKETTLKIIDVISQIKPIKIYLFSDGHRNSLEESIINNLRTEVLNRINWSCEIVKIFSNSNKGVYNQIAKGAEFVFKHEKSAIFLEDDNLPAVTFFQYCKDLLDYYENNPKVFWICGTNYLKSFKTNNDESYIFTQQLLPCGWASWASKFNKYYDFNLENSKLILEKKIKDKFFNKMLYDQQKNSILKEYSNYKITGKFTSWDFHLILTLIKNDLFGVSPKFNQINNIGVDEHSIHGGTSFKNPMTKRFCGIDTLNLNFPLNHPKFVKIDKEYEKKVSNIILYPLKLRIKFKFLTISSRFLRKIFKIDSQLSIREYFKNIHVK